MRYLVAAFLLLPTGAAAQQVPPERTIRVTGVGVVRTPPDVARIDYWVRGEGATPDAASQALATRQKAISGALARLLGAGTDVTSSNVLVVEVKDRSCDDAGYNSQPRLSQGACAVTGYLARMQGTVRTRAVDKAGTAAGLASRLGANDARLAAFELSDRAEAGRRATAAALADAKARAEAIAAGSGARLGALLSVNDQSGFAPGEVVVGAMAMAAPPPPPPEQMAAPVAIDVKPAPIETRQQVFVSYAIDG